MKVKLRKMLLTLPVQSQWEVVQHTIGIQQMSWSRWRKKRTPLGRRRMSLGHCVVRAQSSQACLDCRTLRDIRLRNPTKKGQKEGLLTLMPTDGVSKPCASWVEVSGKGNQWTASMKMRMQS